MLGCIDKGRERRIWVDLPQLAFGGLRRLAIDQPDIIAKEPLSLYYGELCGFLGGTHDVRPWGYDWRRSILDNAKAFATVLGNALTATDQPVRIVAHSMGGLVARSAFLDAKLWQRFQERAGSRLIQLGTPNGGSWSIPYMLMGRDTLMGYLATLDFTMSRREQQQVVVRFPGALQMLPHAETPLFDPARWTALAQLDPGDDDWAAPRADDLAIAARFRDAFAKAPCDPERLLYVAGHAPTMVGIEEDPAAPAGQRIRFRTTHGGRRPGPLEHRHPARHPRLVHRRRAWRPRAPRAGVPGHPRPARDGHHPPPADHPAGRCARTRRAGLKVRDTVPMFPDAEDLLLAGNGRQPQGRRRPIGSPRSGSGWCTAIWRSPGIRCMVGHYAGDTINGAERQLDQALGGRLAKRKQLGLYPGALGTNTVVLDRQTQAARGDRRRPGRSRRSGARHAGRDAAARAAGLCRSRTRTTGRAGPRWRGAAARGHRAAGRCWRRRAADREQRRGAAAGGAGGPAGARQARACGSSRCSSWWRTAPSGLGTSSTVPCRAAEFSGRFELDPAVKVTRGGRRNVAGDDDPTWWQPIQITMEEVGGERVMRYVTTAGRARAEASLVPGNTGFVERFVAQATGAAATGRGTAAAAGRALFELLWPERIKETSREDRNLRLVVDEKTAAFPWELLDDRRPWLQIGSEWRRRAAQARPRSAPASCASSCRASSARRSWRRRARGGHWWWAIRRAEPRARLRRRCRAPRRRPTWWPSGSSAPATK